MNTTTQTPAARSSNEIALRPNRGAYYFIGAATYAVLLNRHCGRQARYDVLVTNGDHATYIGRELPLSRCEKQIAAFETCIAANIGNEWTGAQDQVDAVAQKLKESAQTK